MIGRLCIPLKQAVKMYVKLGEVFSDKKILRTSGPAAFKTTKLKDMLKEIIKDATGNGDEMMLDRKGDVPRCKT